MHSVHKARARIAGQYRVPSVFNPPFGGATGKEERLMVDVQELLAKANESNLDTGVYAIINQANWKLYIGSSSGIEMRLRQHVWQLSKGWHCNRRLQRAWDRDGAESFSFVVLVRCDSDIRIIEEQRMMDAFGTLDKARGYNKRRANFVVRWRVLTPAEIEQRKTTAVNAALLRWQDSAYREKILQGRRRFFLRRGKVDRRGENRFRERNIFVTNAMWNKLRGTPQFELRKMRMAFGRYGAGRTFAQYIGQRRPDLVEHLSIADLQELASMQP